MLVVKTNPEPDLLAVMIKMGDMCIPSEGMARLVVTSCINVEKLSYRILYNQKFNSQANLTHF